MPESTPIAPISQPQGRVESAAGGVPRKRNVLAMALLVVLGGLAGAAGSQVIYQVRELFQVAPERLGMPPRPPRIEREVFLCAVANHALGFAGLGLLLCGAVGLVLGAHGGSTGLAVRGLLVGGGLGLLLGALGGASAFLAYESTVAAPVDAIFKAMLIHMPNWLLLAVAIAIAALAAGRSGLAAMKLLTSALIAGFLAAALYPLLALLLFPAANSDRPIPFQLGLRLLCFMLGGVVLGIAASGWLPARSVGASST